MLGPRTIGKTVVIVVLVQVMAFVMIMLVKDYYAEKNNLTNNVSLQYEK